MANAYFQIIMDNNKTFLRLFPATDGGEPISVKEIQEYISFNRIKPTNSEYIYEVADATEQKDIFLCDGTGFPINEYFKLALTKDKMMAVARFYMPSTSGKQITKEEIINDIKHKGIVVEPYEAMIDKFLAERQYCFNYVVAKGVPPVEGKHASIEYFFNTNPNTKPALNEDGSVDFFNLNTISKCSKGDILATLTPEDRGTKGMRVTGEPILPRDVKTLKLKYANNISLSEDGLSLIADCNGHVSLVDDKVFVSDVYEVVDVDTSTGNIDYIGNILIKGNVKTGFKVKAQGNIEIRGVVEGAEVEATGNVTIAKGFNGMSRGIIKAGGSVVARFIQNGTVDAGARVTAEAIMHSDITTASDVEVTGKKGFIVGGNVKAQGCVIAKTIGSEMGGDTNIEVGVDPVLKNRAKELEGQIKDCKEKMEKVVPVLATFTKKIKEKATLTTDQIRYFKQLSQEYAELKDLMVKLNTEYDEVVEEIDNQPMDSYIAVSGNVYPGAMMTVNDVQKRITTMCAHSRFVADGADVRIKPL
ncbi:MAG: FapA family protein [Lachnospiraceae bacterium]|nr:FapA family protein [Lachnospiraceae bacterium]